MVLYVTPVSYAFGKHREGSTKKKQTERKKRAMWKNNVYINFNKVPFFILYEGLLVSGNVSLYSLLILPLIVRTTFFVFLLNL